MSHDQFLEFYVYAPDGTFLAVLESAFDKAYTCRLSAVGAGRFRISALDAKSTDVNLAIGNIVKVRYENQFVGAWVIERKQETVVGPGEGADEIIEVSGRDIMALLETAIVYPSDPSDPRTVERTWTGVTRAAIMLDLLDEAHARGWNRIMVDFTASTDSAGAPFTDSNSISYKAGDTLLAVALNHAEMGTEFVVTHDGTLQYYVEKGSDVTDHVFLRKGQNILTCRVETDGSQLRNVALGEGRYVLAVGSDAGSISDYGRAETYLAADNVDDSTQLALLVEALLAQQSQPRYSLSISTAVEPYAPFSDYNLGDWVRVEIESKFSGDYRVVGIGVAEQNGTLIVDLELTSVVSRFMERLKRAVENTAAASITSLASALAQVRSGSQKLRVQVVDSTADLDDIENPVDGLVAHASDTGIDYTYSDGGWRARGGAYQFNALSADPPDPGDGEAIMWMSDGTGTGDPGDMLMKITVGSTTKTITLVDFSEV